MKLSVQTKGVMKKDNPKIILARLIVLISTLLLNRVAYPKIMNKNK